MSGLKKGVFLPPFRGQARCQKQPFRGSFFANRHQNPAFIPGKKEWSSARPFWPRIKHGSFSRLKKNGLDLGKTGVKKGPFSGINPGFVFLAGSKPPICLEKAIRVTRKHGVKHRFFFLRQKRQIPPFRQQNTVTRHS